MPEPARFANLHESQFLPASASIDPGAKRYSQLVPSDDYYLEGGCSPIRDLSALTGGIVSLF